MLVDVARQLFARMGVDNTTMNDIAQASRKADVRYIRISRAKMRFIWLWWNRSWTSYTRCCLMLPERICQLMRS